MSAKNTEATFWEKVERGAHDACWPWKRGKQGRGYGCMGYHGRVWQAHRLAYQFTHSDLGAEDKVRHTCDNVVCCNPAHLIKGTQGQNIQDMIDRHRTRKGEERPQHKLKANQVREIRRRYGEGGITYQQLAAIYGVSDSCVWGVLSGQTWKHLLPAAGHGCFERE